MAISIKVSAGGGGMGGGQARHNTRQTELGVAEREESRTTSLAQSRELDRGPRFWTRNIPECVLSEDEVADRFAAHVYGWESDRGLAEERLRQESERGQLTTEEGKPAEFANQGELDRAMVERRETDYGDVQQVEREVIHFRAFFDMRDREETALQKPGRGKAVTHYGIVFSFDQPISNREIKELVEKFCESQMAVLWSKKRGRQMFDNPLRDVPAGFVIHRDGTEHTHCHGQWDCRLPNGRKVRIPPQVWKSFDEHWGHLLSEHVHEPELLREHMEKKKETLDWKRKTHTRKAAGLPPEPKPEREADIRDQKALKHSSQIKTDLRTLGLDPQKFRIALNLKGYRSNENTHKLMARAELTEARFLHALATNKSAEEIARTNQEATALNLEVQAVHKTRESQGKCPPTLYYTDKQYAELQSLKGERLAAAKDDRLAGVLAGYGEYVRQTTREECAQAGRFIEERSGSVFEVEDGGRWSLQGIEGMIGRESERLGRIDDTKSQKNRRGESTSTLSKLKKTGWELQEKIAVREKQLLQTAEAARWRFEVVSRAIEEAKEVRTQAGKSWPSPIYSSEAYQNIDHLSHRTRDARLAKHLHEKSLGANSKPEFILASAEIEFGRELVARKELLQKEARYRGATERKSSSRDKAGSDSQTVSAPQVKQAGAEYQGARDYYEARREIVDDHLRLLGLSREDIVPRVSSEELKEIKGYSASIKPNKENKVLIRQTSRARLYQHEQFIFVEEKPVSRDKEPERSAMPSKKSRIRDAKTAIEKLFLESTRTGKGALHPVENVLHVANAAREELTRRGVTLKEIGYTREQWASTMVDNAVRDLHRYCLSSGSGEHDYSFKQSQSLLDAVNRNESGLLFLVAGPTNSEGARTLDIESQDPKEEHTLLKTHGASRAEDIQLSTKDPHVRAGLIQGQYIEEYVKLGFLEQSGVVVDRGNLEYLRLEMMNANGEHLKQYGGMPLAILSKEQKELAQSYKEMGGHLPEQIHDKLQDGLVIGESRTDSRLEREQVHEQVREFIEELSR